MIIILSSLVWLSTTILICLALDSIEQHRELWSPQVKKNSSSWSIFSIRFYFPVVFRCGRISITDIFLNSLLPKILTRSSHLHHYYTKWRSYLQGSPMSPHVNFSVGRLFGRSSVGWSVCLENCSKGISLSHLLSQDLDFFACSFLLIHPFSLTIASL